jgi:hypothetical protein
MLLYQLRILQRARYDGDCRAVHAEHCREKLVCQRQIFPSNAVVNHQNPAATPGFDRMHRIAGDGLQRLNDKRLKIF